MHSGNARKELTSAALDAMHRYGYRGCSIEAITDAADVPMGSFYNHFKSKEMLALEALNQYWREMASRLVSLNDSKLSSKDSVLQHFRDLNSMVRGRDCRAGCFIGNLGAEMSEDSDAIRNQLEKILSDWSGTLEAWVRRGHTDGSIRCVLSPASLSRFLVNAWQGSAIRAKVERSDVPLTDFEQLVAAIIDG